MSRKNSTSTVHKGRKLRTTQGNSCYYCGVEMTEPPIPPDPHRPTDRTIDHIVPVARGGTNSIVNLCLCCAACNVGKGDKSARQWLAILAARREEAASA